MVRATGKQPHRRRRVRVRHRGAHHKSPRRARSRGRPRAPDVCTSTRPLLAPATSLTPTGHLDNTPPAPAATPPAQKPPNSLRSERRPDRNRPHRSVLRPSRGEPRPIPIRNPRKIRPILRPQPLILIGQSAVRDDRSFRARGSPDCPPLIDLPAVQEAEQLDDREAEDQCAHHDQGIAGLAHREVTWKTVPRMCLGRSRATETATDRRPISAPGDGDGGGVEALP